MLDGEWNSWAFLNESVNRTVYLCCQHRFVRYGKNIVMNRCFRFLWIISYQRKFVNKGYVQSTTLHHVSLRDQNIFENEQLIMIIILASSFGDKNLGLDFGMTESSPILNVFDPSYTKLKCTKYVKNETRVVCFCSLKCNLKTHLADLYILFVLLLCICTHYFS